MKRFAIFLVALGSALLLIQAGCGGGGGGGGVGFGNPAFTTVDNLVAPAGTNPAFSAAVAIDEGAGTAADPAIAVGAADDGAGNLRAVAWQITITGATVAETAVPLLPAGVYSRANGINAAGTIVGEMNSPIVPAIWSSTAQPAVAIPIGGAASGAAYDINDSGKIVGETITALGVPTAVSWTLDNGVITGGPVQLGQPNSTANAVGSTTAGVTLIVGEHTDAAGSHAVVWRDNTTTITETILPGITTATPALTGESTALSINADGTIVGEITDADGFLHAVRWTRGAGGVYTAQDMGLGTANAINGGGRVVGIAPVGTAGANSAGAWGAGGSVPILMNAGLSGGQGYGISDSGRATGVNAAGQAFIALP